MKDIVLEVIKDWEYFELPEVLERRVNPLEFMSWKVKKVVSIAGFRRTGKTFLLFKISKSIGKENALYINFEDERLRNVSFKDFLDAVREHYGKRRVVLLLDEIQEVERWGKWLRTLNDMQNFFVFATGSSSKLGLDSLPYELRGRTITLFLFPLDFTEFLKFKKEKESIPKGILLRYLREYLEFGGMPEVVLVEKKKLILHEYFETFVSRDLVERHGIRNPECIRVILKYLLDSQYVTYSKLYNFLRSAGYMVGKETVIRYLNYIESSLFAHFLRIYGSAKKQEQVARKVYVVDNGFISKYSFNAGTGRLMENIIAIELLRRRYYNFLDYEVYYFKDYQQHEVDFLIKEGLRIKQLIQVTYANSFDEIDKREWRSLIRAYELFKRYKPELLIITWDYEDEREISWFNKRAKVKFIPLWEWLLHKNLS